MISSHQKTPIAGRDNVVAFCAMEDLATDTIPAKPLISCGRRLERCIERYCPELDAARLCNSAGVKAAQIFAEAGGLTPEEYASVLLALVEETGNRGLPILIGLEARVRDFGLFGHSLMSCSSFEELATVGERYSPLNGYCFSSSPVLGEGYWALRIEQTSKAQFGGIALLLQEFIALSAKILADILYDGDIRQIKTLCFTSPPPPGQGDLPNLPGSAVLFTQPHNEIRLRAESMKIPPGQSSQEIARFLWQQCEEQLRRYRAHNADSLQDAIRHFLAQRRPDALPSREQIAKHLNISPRTLNRKLQQQGTSFRQLLNNERMRAARQMLETSSASVESIAHHLGYAQPSSFFRAYRKHYGVTPKSNAKETVTERTRPAADASL